MSGSPGMEVGAIYATIEACGFAKFVADIQRIGTAVEQAKSGIQGFITETYRVQKANGASIAGAFAKQFTGVAAGAGAPSSAIAPPKPKAGGLFPEHIQSTNDQLTRLRRPITVMQRDFARLGGEMTRGMQILGTVFQHAIGKQMETQLKLLRRDMIDHIAKLRGWGPATTGAVRGLVTMHTELGKFQKRQELVNTLLGPFSSMASKAFYTLSGGIMGFVTAGLAGTVQGAALSYQFQQLSRQIAAIFLPVIQEVFDYVSRLVNGFRGLSMEQQDNIRRWVLWGAAILAALKFLPTIIGLVSGLWSVLKLGADALTALLASPWGPMIAGAAAFLGVMGYITLKIGEANKKMLELAETIGKPETTEEKFKKDPLVQQLEQMKTRGASREEMAKVIQAEEKRRLAQETEATDYLQGSTGIGYGGRAASGKVGEAQEKAKKGASDYEIARLARQKYVYGQDVSKDLKGGIGRYDLTPKASGFESLTASFNRVQTSALATDAKLLEARKTNDKLEEINHGIKQMNGNPGAAPLVMGA